MGQPITISEAVLRRLVKFTPLYWTPGRGISSTERVILQQYPVVMIGSVPAELDAWLSELPERWLELLDKWRVVTTEECWTAQSRVLHPETICHIRPVVTPDFPTALELARRALGGGHDLVVRLTAYIVGVRPPDHDPRVSQRYSYQTDGEESCYR